MKTPFTLHKFTPKAKPTAAPLPAIARKAAQLSDLAPGAARILEGLIDDALTRALARRKDAQ